MKIFYLSFLFVFLNSFIIYSQENINKTILIFAAHPDDEIIGCGAFIANQIKQNNKVFIIYFTSGDAGSQKYEKQILIKLREKEAISANKILGVPEQNLFFLHQPDGFLEINKNILIKSTELIREISPDIILIPQSEEAHLDHKITNQIAQKAINMAKGNWFKEAKGNPWATKTILEYEIYPLMKEINYCLNTKLLFNLKLKALEEHKTQLESFDYIKLIQSVNSYRTLMNGGGECFKIIKINEI